MVGLSARGVRGLANLTNAENRFAPGNCEKYSKPQFHLHRLGEHVAKLRVNELLAYCSWSMFRSTHFVSTFPSTKS